jgi:catechol 2,3-dioxygenase-like lactoylglutathione lyase family enzyme
VDVQKEPYSSSSFPTLAVRDLLASQAWYQQMLGFKLISTMHNPQGQLILAHLRWGQQADLVLVPQSANPVGEPKGAGVMLTFLVSPSNIERLTKLATMTEPALPTFIIQPWGEKAVLITDPDGYQLVFTQNFPAQQRASLDPTFVICCRRSLTECIGPIADLLMDRAIAQHQSSSPDELINILAKQIPDAAKALEFRQRLLSQTAF